MSARTQIQQHLTFISVMKVIITDNIYTHSYKRKYSHKMKRISCVRINKFLPKIKIYNSSAMQRKLRTQRKARLKNHFQSSYNLVDKVNNHLWR